MEEKTKICSNPNCIHNGQPQPISNFGKSKKAKDGFNWWCKDCIRMKNQENKEKRRKWNEEHKEEISQYQHQYNLNNKDKIRAKSKKWYEENKNKKNKLNKKWKEEHLEEWKNYQKEWYNALATYDTYADKLEKYINIRRDPNNLELIQVQCYYSKCHKWFNPTNIQLQHRLQSINGTLHGENNLYCSEDCKDRCPAFGLNPNSINKKEETHCTRDDALHGQFRDIILELDNYTCQKCGRNREEEPDIVLYCHHIIPFSQDPSLASDVNNGITLCDNCHNKFYHNNKEDFPECTLQFLKKNSKLNKS